MPIPLLLALLPIAAQPVSTDPITPALAGKLECTQPDVTRKTCRSLASYKANGDGTYNNTAVILISPQGPVTFENSASVTLKSGRVCGILRAEDIAAGKLRVAGQLLEQARATSALAQIATAMAPMLGKEICNADVPDGAAFTEKTYIDGAYQDGQDQKLMWVGASEGYVVAP